MTKDEVIANIENDIDNSDGWTFVGVSTETLRSAIELLRSSSDAPTVHRADWLATFRASLTGLRANPIWTSTVEGAAEARALAEEDANAAHGVRPRAR